MIKQREELILLRENLSDCLWILDNYEDSILNHKLLKLISGITTDLYYAMSEVIPK